MIILVTGYVVDLFLSLHEYEIEIEKASHKSILKAFSSDNRSQIAIHLFLRKIAFKFFNDRMTFYHLLI